MRIERFGAACGASVTEVDLAGLDDATFAAMHEAWLEHLVLAFPGQHLTPEAQRDFALRFGELEVHAFAEKHPAAPEVTVLHSERGGRADVWHTDVTWSPAPPIAAVLRHLSGPDVGGDTMWANQYLAYETLSAPMRAFLDDLTAVHTAWTFGRPETRAERPVVLVHPETGRRALAVNRLFTTRIPQLSSEESAALLAHLFAWGERPELTCRWHWSPGDVLLWDNRCTRHYAIGDYDDERVLHRVTVLGTYAANPDQGSCWPHAEEPRLSASSALRMRQG